MTGIDASGSGGLPESELAPIRVVVDGLIVPIFLARPPFRLTLELARAGYSTRRLTAGSISENLIEDAVRFARERQSQRAIRTRNMDWEFAWPYLEGALWGSCALVASKADKSLGAAQFDLAFRLLGLDVGAHRRVALLRALAEKELLVEVGRKRWRVAADWRQKLDLLAPQWRLHFGLNQVVPALFQRFNQVEGSALSLRGVRLTPMALYRLQDRLSQRLGDICGANIVPLSAVRHDVADVALVASFHCLWPIEVGVEAADPMSEATRFLLLAPVAEGLRRIGPWPVAQDVLKRGFVEAVGESTGLSGVQLYDFISRRYGVRSANTVRSFLTGPSLSGVARSPGFNRGLVLRLALLIRMELSTSGFEAVLESQLRDRITRLPAGVHALDAGLWQAAIATLEEEVIIGRSMSASGSTLKLLRRELGIVKAGLDQMEESSRALLARLPQMANVAASGSSIAQTSVDFWIVRRSELPRIRRDALAALDAAVREQTEQNLDLTIADEQSMGMIRAELLLATRVMPLHL